MGEPKTTTPGTLTTNTQIPTPPDLVHLKRHLSVTNGPRRQKIKEDLANCKQRGRPVEVYYKNLTKIMDTYYRPLHVCKCGHCECDLASLQEKEREDDMVHQFLYGLDGHKFQTVRSKVTSQIPLPSLKEAYKIIRQEEDLQNSSRNLKEKKQRPRVVQVVTDPVSEGLLLELLACLPDKSLSRFKSVSKQWKTMIESSYLAKKRLARSKKKLFVLRVEMSTDRHSRTIYLENIAKNHHDHDKIIIYTYKFPHPYPTNDVGTIVGSCNGLVCIYDLGYVYLINPATRKLRILSSEILREYACLSGWAGKLPVSVGFGRDIVTKAYKVLFMYLPAGGDNIVKTEVLNLHSGERQFICFPLTYDELSDDKLPVFAN